MTRANTIEDLLDKIFIQENGCWEFSGACNNKGYGTFYIKGVNYKTHRLAYEYYKGSIPENLMVLHDCDNRRCCNPEHLFLGTNKDNVNDRVIKGRSAINNGANNYFASLSHEQANEIRNSSATTSILAAKYMVDRSTIKRIRAGRTYKCQPV
jgi:hypothetical protein